MLQQFLRGILHDFFAFYWPNKQIIGSFFCSEYKCYLLHWHRNKNDLSHEQSLFKMTAFRKPKIVLPADFIIRHKPPIAPTEMCQTKPFCIIISYMHLTSQSLLLYLLALSTRKTKSLFLHVSTDIVALVVKEQNAAEEITTIWLFTHQWDNWGIMLGWMLICLSSQWVSLFWIWEHHILLHEFFSDCFFSLYIT